MDAFQTALTIMALIFGIMLWSYAILGDNYAFATGEAVFLAGNASSSAYGLLKSLNSDTLVPIAGGSIVMVVALLLGATAFTRLTRYRWAARYATAIMSGMGVGVLFGLNIRSQILNGVIETISGVASSLLTPAGRTIGGFEVPGGAVAVSWIFAGIMFLIMVLTFSYSRAISGRFFNPDSPLRWISRIGRIFIMIMLGHIACKTLLGDSLDSLITFIQIIIIRTIDAFKTGISPY